MAKSLMPVLDQLHRDQIVVQCRYTYPGGTHVKFFATEEPTLGDFSPEEIAIVDHIIDDVCYGHTARSISDLSYDITWKMHEIGEEMPLYRSHVMRLGQVTDEDIAWATASPENGESIAIRTVVCERVAQEAIEGCVSAFKRGREVCDALMDLIARRPTFGERLPGRASPEFMIRSDASPNPDTSSSQCTTGLIRTRWSFYSKLDTRTPDGFPALAVKVRFLHDAA